MLQRRQARGPGAVERAEDDERNGKRNVRSPKPACRRDDQAEPVTATDLAGAVPNLPAVPAHEQESEAVRVGSGRRDAAPTS